MRIKQKKSLGQNFLRDKNSQYKIISLCRFRPDDIVLEIGAGAGDITALISRLVKTVYAVEIDRRFSEVLQGRFVNSNVTVINFDILKLDLNKIFSSLQRKIKVFGNIPYYITTPIIEFLIRHKSMIGEAYLTVQKELGERLCSGPGTKEYGASTIFTGYHFNPEVLAVIKKEAFVPVPKVDSSLLRLEVRDRPAVELRDEGYFFRLVRAAFSQRRKMLVNSLSKAVPKEKLSLFFKTYKLDPRVRPEELSAQDFANLANL